MEPRFAEVVPGADDAPLVAWLAGEEWPFHVNPRPEPDQVRRWIDEGIFASDEARTWWILGSGGERAGLLRLFDLEDDTPMFDLRVASAHRGRGVATAALRWLTDVVFTTMPGKVRIEGTTRRDNLAMRRVFRKCGYAKEAHYRRAWPGPGGERFDTVGYGVLREDWERGTVTPVAWDDE